MSGFGHSDLGLFAYRATEHEATGVFHGQLVVGSKLRTTMPSIASQLIPQLVNKSSKRKTELASKSGGRI